MKSTTPVLVGMIVVALSACAKTTKLNGITTEDVSGSSVVKEPAFFKVVVASTVFIMPLPRAAMPVAPD